MKRLREKCMECGEPIPESNRVDSKFCDPSCKARYWRKKKEQGQTKTQGVGNVTPNPLQNQPLNSEPLEGLRGVMDNTPKEGKKDTNQKAYHAVQDCVTEDRQVENSEYTKLLDKKTELKSEIKREEGYLIRFDEDIKKEGTVQTHDKGKGFKFDRDFKKSSDTYQLRDILFPEEGLEFDENPDSKKQNRIKELREGKIQCQKALEHNRAVLIQVMEILEKTPRYKPQAKIIQPTLIDLLEGIKSKKMAQEQQMDNTESNQDNMQENENSLEGTNADSRVETNDRILSSTEVLKINYKSFMFQGRWKEFLGQPAVIFHTAVHGLPGGGKSTFCLQFSEYLAKNFGKVIYVCGEEGYSKTLKEKLQRNNINSPNLYFHDAKNYDDIKQYVRANKFHFIVIDSLDTLRIDAVRLKDLKAYYSRSAFITISQSRKDGKMKGDNEILHDADTVIAVHKGIATTSKNRFNPSDRRFEVFPSEGKS